MKEQARIHRRKPIDRRLIRFLGVNLAIGALSGWAFVAALLYLDIGGFGALVQSSADRLLATAILIVVITITWGSAAMGTAVFLLPKSEKPDDGGAPAPASRAAAPIALAAARARTPRRN